MKKTPTAEAEAAQNLTPAQVLGTAPIIPDAPELPAINASLPIKALSIAIARNLPQNPPRIFRRKDACFTIHTESYVDKSGDKKTETFTREMDAERLPAFLENFMQFRKGADEDADVVSLGKQKAAQVLKSDDFLAAVAPIRELANVRLPAWRRMPDGSKKVSLCAPGYDREAQIFTEDAIQYADDGMQPMTPDEIHEIWAKFMSGYPFFIESEADQKHAAAVLEHFTARRNAAAEAGEEFTESEDDLQMVDVTQNRSACVAMAAMLGQYCRFLYDRAPMLIINANQPGTGKSHLAWFLLSAAYGTPPGSPCPADDTEMAKVLTAALLEGAPFYLFDDVRSLASQTINLFITTSKWRGRLLAQNKTILLDNNCQLIATGNALTTTPDIERRALIVDLWLSKNATSRRFKNVTSKESFADVSTREPLLFMLYSMVQNWAAAGCPSLVSGNEKLSFESFAAVIGSIMRVNGFGSPFRARTGEFAGGDLRGRTLELLISSLAMEIPNGQVSQTFKLRHFEALAIRGGWRETLTGGAKDFARSVGRQLTTYRNRTLYDLKNRPFIFGRGEDSGSSNYTIIRQFTPDPDEFPKWNILREVAEGHLYPQEKAEDYADSLPPAPDEEPNPFDPY